MRDARLNAKGNTTSDARKRALEKWAATPALFVAIRQPKKRYLCVPRHSSENRRVVPMWFCEPDHIAHDSTVTIDGAPLWLFGLMQSAMYDAWLRSVVGRLKSDIRVAPDLAYNAFPFPDPPVGDDAKGLDAAAQGVLDARDRHAGLPLAVLYDQLAMPPDLVAAHDELDKVADKVLAPRRKMGSEADRLSALFDRFAHLSAPLTTAAMKPRKPSRGGAELDI